MENGIRIFRVRYPNGAIGHRLCVLPGDNLDEIRREARDAGGVREVGEEELPLAARLLLGQLMCRLIQAPSDDHRKLLKLLEMAMSLGAMLPELPSI